MEMGNGDIPHFVVTNGDGVGRRRAFRGLTRSAPSRSRALRKFPDGNFRRWLVGSLRALTSAEMAALKCIAAARSGFLLAALHSVAERVNPRKARPPAPHDPRVLASAGRPHLPLLGKECTAPRAQQGPEHRVLRSFPPSGTQRDGSATETKLRIVAAEACGAVFGQTGTDRVGWYACPRLTLFATEWSAARKKPMRAAALHLSAAISADVKARRILTSGRQEMKWGHSPIPRFAGKWGQTSQLNY